MRILYVSPYPPARDGIGTYTHVLARAVREHGHEVAVVAARSHPGAPEEVVGALDDGVGALRAAVARFRPDVAHVQFAVPAFGARTVAVARWLAAPEVPVVATLHEVSRDTALLRGPGRALYRRVGRAGQRLIVHTRAALDTLTSLGLDGRATVVPHFSAPPPPPPAPPATCAPAIGWATPACCWPSATSTSARGSTTWCAPWRRCRPRRWTGCGSWSPARSGGGTARSGCSRRATTCTRRRCAAWHAGTGCSTG
ncbi:unnamed protein product [[Actinomadura] parvosata subsp. kistnae]|nr:unnamed protein product [Actinomadura parvosata subsp. kistnae]